jgi:hypothetical protein
MAHMLDPGRDSFSSGPRRHCQNSPVISFLIYIRCNSEACQQLQKEPFVSPCGNGIQYAYYIVTCRSDIRRVLDWIAEFIAPHNVQPLTFGNPLVILTTRFTFSCSRVSLKVLLNSLLLPRCSCCLRPRFLIPVLRSGPFQLSSRPFVLSGFLVRHRPCRVSLTPCHSCTAVYPSAGDGKFIQRPTLALGPFLRLPAAPCS